MVDLISAIIGLLQKGINPDPYLHNKGGNLDKNDMNTKYQLLYGGKGFLINSIKDSDVQATTKILCSKVLRKMRPAEYTGATVELAEKCAQGVHINRSQFLLNELMDDAREVQEQPTTKFHFSWILILISFVVWAPPPNYQPMDILVELLRMPFQNI